MTSSRRWLLLGLALTGALRVHAAGANPDGVAVLWLGPRLTEHSTERQDEITARIVGALRPVVRGTVAIAPPTADSAGLLDDLRLLPKRLAEHPPAGGRYVLCVRVVPGNGLAPVGELAVVDLAELRLLGYKAVPLPATWLLGPLVDEAFELVAHTVPLSTTGDATVSRASHPDATTVAWSASDPIRDAPPTATAGIPTAKFVSPRPRPLPAELPAEATEEPTRPKTPPSAAVTGVVAAQVSAATPTAGVDLDLLLRRYGGQMMAMGGLGQANSRPKVVENSYEMLLVPTANPDPAEPPVRMTVTIYAIGEEARIESRFSRPVETRSRPRDGNWASIDLVGYRVETETGVDVARSGLLALHVKPTEAGDTRLGLELTGAGEVDLETAPDHKILLATIRKSAQRARRAGLVDSELPYGGDCHTLRRLRGVASWYGGSCHGGPTASGERFNQWAMTAAHKTLPLGSWVKVTNLRTGRAVVLRINDRGPYIGGRIIDVSAGAAQALGFYGSGLTTVDVEVLGQGR